MIAACNSVSAYAIDELKSTAPFKVSGVIEPGVLALCNKIQNKDAKILILGTKATINSGKYEKLLKEHGYKNIESLSPSLFVPIVEEGLFEGEVLKTVMEHYFKNVSQPDAIILGCTHFPLIAKEIHKYFPKATLIHSGEAVVEFLEDEFDIKENHPNTTLKLFASENPDKLKEIAKVWLR
jgi:glutamate racemase